MVTCVTLVLDTKAVGCGERGLGYGLVFARGVGLAHILGVWRKFKELFTGVGISLSNDT